MHEKKKNASATKLYQVVRVQEKSFDNRTKNLNLKCFSNLYPYGKNGQKTSRETGLTDFDLLKTKLVFKHSQFRTNL